MIAARGVHRALCAHGRHEVFCRHEVHGRHGGHGGHGRHGVHGRPGSHGKHDRHAGMAGMAGTERAHVQSGACPRHFLGDAIFVRAARRIEPGEEPSRGTSCARRPRAWCLSEGPCGRLQSGLGADRVPRDGGGGLGREVAGSRHRDKVAVRGRGGPSMCSRWLGALKSMRGHWRRTKARTIRLHVRHAQEDWQMCARTSLC